MSLNLVGIALTTMGRAQGSLLLGVEPVVENILGRVSGTFGIAVSALGSDETFFHNENSVFPAASTIKLYILVELFNQIQSGRHKLEELLQVPSGQKGPVTEYVSSGVLKELQSVKQISLQDAATLMVIVSDNLAANMLIDFLGMDRIQDTIQRLGLAQTKLARKMMDLEASRKGIENLSTPYELMLTMRKLAKAEFLDGNSSAVILRILARNQYPLGLRRLIPDYIVLENKTGDLFNVSNDVGIIRVPKNPFVVSVMSKDVNLVEGYDTIARLGRIFYERFRAGSRKK